jgi:hypothetical protein
MPISALGCINPCMNFVVGIQLFLGGLLTSAGGVSNAVNSAAQRVCKISSTPKACGGVAAV